MSSPIVEPVEGPFVLGEGPHWDEKSQSLYGVDIEKKQIFKYHPETKVLKKVQLDQKVGFVIPVKDKSDLFVIGLGPNIATIKWDGESTDVETVEITWRTNEDDPLKQNRINDGKSDPSGRLWAGSMCQEKINGDWQLEKCNLFTFDKSGPKKLLSKVHLSNGLAWSLDHKTLYYIDSLLYNVRSFDYDLSTGDIGNEKVVFDLKVNNIPGIPDGMTIDQDGKLWVSVFGGGKIIRIDPNSGELLFTLEVPAYLTTSVAFGGKNYDELYITSANVPLSPEEEKIKEKYTFNGYLFKATGLGVKGLPPTDVEF